LRLALFRAIRERESAIRAFFGQKAFEGNTVVEAFLETCRETLAARVSQKSTLPKRQSSLLIELATRDSSLFARGSSVFAFASQARPDVSKAKKGTKKGTKTVVSIAPAEISDELCQQVVGLAVFHPRRGRGTIQQVAQPEVKGKAILVRFDNAEEHSYSWQAATKLSIGAYLALGMQPVRKGATECSACFRPRVP
jgi:hypothetical protein